MYNLLTTFWRAVRDTFPEAWALESKNSRLMHSAGIIAMGVLMDRIYAKIGGQRETYEAVLQELARVAPYCAWTTGQWPMINVQWNEIQSTPQDIKALQETLIRLYMTSAHQ